MFVNCILGCPPSLQSDMSHHQRNNNGDGGVVMTMTTLVVQGLEAELREPF